MFYMYYIIGGILIYMIKKKYFKLLLEFIVFARVNSNQ